MKKMFFVISICLVLTFISTSVFAAGIKGWTELTSDGNKAEAVGGAIKVTGTGKYLSKDMGAVFSTPVDLNDFSIEFSLDKYAGNVQDGSDHWYGISLLNKKVPFNITKPESGEGLVVLMRPNSDGTLQVQFYELSEAMGFASNGANFPLAAPAKGEKLKIKMKKNADTGYDFIFNGTKVETDLSFLPDLLENGSAYLSMLANDAAERDLQFTIYSVNDTDAVKASAAAATSGQTSAENPKTGDMSVMPYILLAGASVVGLRSFRAKK